jgi:hypothetical protein
MSQPQFAGYFRSGLPYNRSGRGPRPLVVFQGLMLENKPMPRMALGMYKFLEDDYTVYSVLRKRGLPHGYTLQDMAADYAAMIREEFGGPLDVIGISTGGSIVQHDPFYTPTLFRETAAGIPNARLYLYPNMGHPAGGKQFQRDVLTFLREQV